MKTRLVYTGISIFLFLHGYGQQLNLVNSINYHKRFSDIEYSQKAPYLPLFFTFELHPQTEAQVIEDAPVMMEASSADTTPPPPPPKKIPQVKYAAKLAGQADIWPLGADEYALYCEHQKVITTNEGDSALFLYRVSGKKLIKSDSILLHNSPNCYGITALKTPEGRTYFIKRTCNEDNSSLLVIDTTLKTIKRIDGLKSSSEVQFLDEDLMLIATWDKQSTTIAVWKYSLLHGKLNEISVDMSGQTSSWSVGIVPVNDTLMLVYAQMYSSRKTVICATNFKNIKYWQASIPDYIDNVTVLPKSNKMVLTCYNIQGGSTISFYSLATGKPENTIDLKRTFPEYTAATSWPVFLPMWTAAMPDGKWVVCLVNCYSPSDQKIKSNYLFMSNGIKKIKTKLPLSHSVSNHFKILSESKIAVIMDNTIYYYSFVPNP